MRFFRADYDVLYADSVYQYAAAGGNRGNYPWVLNRKDSLEEEIYN
ncbi:lipocalin family protein [Sebaldella termitidis]